MLESPLIQEIVVEAKREMIWAVLGARFGRVSAEVVAALQPVVQCFDKSSSRNLPASA